MVSYTTTYNLKKPTVADDEDVWGGYLNDSMDLIDDVLDGTTPVTGIDINSGTIDNVVVGGTTAVAGTFTVLTANTSLGVTGNITVSGTVDGRDVAADGTKLDGVESGATADQTKADIDALGIAATTASTLATARNIAVTGAVTGNANFDGSGNISISTTATADPTLTLSGDASGSTTFTNLGNATLTVTVADDSHNHVISNVDGLQTALNGKQASGTYNTVIGTDSDINTSGSTIIDNIFVTDGVITSMGTRTLTLGDLGYTGATNANYITNNNQLTNGAGYTTYSANQSLNTNSGPTFHNIYNNDWFRNQQSGEGLYNTATTQHWYSDNDDWWNVAGGSGANGIRFRDEHNGTIRGSVYATNSNEVGFLDSDGNWAYRHARDTAHYWSINNSLKMQLAGDGLFLADGSLKEDYDALSGTSPNCNVNNGGAFSLTMTGNTTFTFSAGHSGYSHGFILQLTGNGSTVTWPSSVKWAGGTAPDAPASGETDIYVFWTRDGGTTWYGVQSIDAAA